MSDYLSLGYPNYPNQFMMNQFQYPYYMNYGFYNQMQSYNPTFQAAPQNTGVATTQATPATGTTTTTTGAAEAIKEDGKKAYIALNKKCPSSTSKKKLSIYETTPEKLAEYKQKSKKDKISRTIVGLTLIGLSVFGLFRKDLKAVDDILNFVKGFVKDPKYDKVIEWGTVIGSAAAATFPGILIASSERKQKKLAEEYFPDSTLVQKSDKQIKKEQRKA